MLPSDFEFFVGTIALFPKNLVPDGWLICDGSTHNAQAYAMLNSLIMAQYGGQPGVTFAVPDLRGARGFTRWAYAISTTGLFPTA